MPSVNKEIGSVDYPRLREADLILRAKEGDAAAFGCLLEACLPAIRQSAFSFARSRELFEELIHEGKVALWERVVLHFETNQSENFKGYLSRCLRSAMLDHINTTKARGVNRNVRMFSARLLEQNKIFENQTGRKMTDEELADFLTRDRERQYTAAEVRSFLEYSLPNHRTSPLTEDLLPNPAGPPDEEAARHEEIGLIRKKALAAMRPLGKRNGDIYRRHTGLGRDRQEWTLEAIGQRYGITKERVRQLVSKSHQRVSAILSVDPALKEISNNWITKRT